MRAVAAMVVACLLSQTACTLVPGMPKRAGRTMNIGWAVVGVLAVPPIKCRIEDKVSEDPCLIEDAVLVLVGVPVLLVFGIIAGAQDHDDPAAAPADTVADGELPAIPTDAETLQLARQAKAAADAGQCVAARATMDRIAARDADYHIALQIKGVLGGCP